jgi:UDPglucose 6-dehydrogenase
MNISFDNVKNMMLQNNWINPMHTIIPGPDGKISYGGACFPKDIEALSNYMKDQYVSNFVLDAVIKENKEIRK